jgi:hypothetical protein
LGLLSVSNLLIAAGAVVAFAVGAVITKATDPARHAPALTASVVHGVVEAPALPPQPVQVARSVAMFGKGRLGQCIDFEYAATFLMPDAGIGAPEKLAKYLDSALDSEMKANTKGQAITKLSQSCGEQFRDRTVLATCALTQHKDAPQGSLDLTVHTKYYLFTSVFGDDREMQSCLSDGGQWKAIARNSPEYRRLKHEETMAQATKYLDQASELAAQPTP